VFDRVKAEFGSERDELKKLVGEGGYDAVRRSTLNAHFTVPEITKAMWRMAEHLGFKGGRVLEGAVGTGILFDTMPERMKRRCNSLVLQSDEA
jgi:hypothetical protein